MLPVACVSSQSLSPEEKFLLVPFCLRNGSFPLLREGVNVIAGRLVFFFFLRRVGRAVLPQERKPKSSVAEWVALLLLETWHRL